MQLALSQQPESNRLQYRLKFAPATKLPRRVLKMKDSCSFGNVQRLAYLPSEFSFHRPTKRLYLARCKRGCFRILWLRRKYAQRSDLSVDREQLQLSNDAGQDFWVRRQMLVSVAADEEMLVLR